MRAKIAFCAVMIALAGRAGADAPAPAPQGCPDITDNKTNGISGSDPACDAAIAAEKDPKAKSVLLFRRAYREDAAGDVKSYPKVFADLDEAIKLWPQNADALYERGYLDNEEGHWQDAEADLSASIAISPAEATGYEERALARFKLGKLDQMLVDDNMLVTLEPDKAENYTIRARAQMWNGKFDAARADIDKAVALAAGDAEAVKTADDLRAALALWTNRSPAAPAAQACADADKNNALGKDGTIGDCTRAFLDASTPNDKAHALTRRANAWRKGPRDMDASLDDYEMAATFFPKAETLSNVGWAYIRLRNSALAIEAFDRSIALHADFYNYAGRATAKCNLRDYQGALDDIKQSMAIKPNDVALIVQGDVVYAQTKSYDQAKTFWLKAWDLGDRESALVERLKDAGVTPPADKPAVQKP
jgi:tetratricopeptide (TPR) repeat protein